MNVQQWQYYIEENIGFVLPKAQLQWLVNAIEQTAKAHNLSLAQLWFSIKVDDKLRQQLLDAVLIPESRFFRHLPSIQFISDLAVQAQTAGNNQHKDAPFRIWSVGCATGQEVWSLAMSLSENDVADYEILGTDVSQQALAKAHTGRYTERERQTIEPIYQKFMQPMPSAERIKPSVFYSDNDSSFSNDSGYYNVDNEHYQIASGSDIVTLNRSTSIAKTWNNKSLSSHKLMANVSQTQRQVAPILRQHVRFIWHNIFTTSMPTTHLQNVIICQNMLIYFRQFDQRDILTRLAMQCELGGYIVLAPGEALFWRPSNMRRIAHPQVNAWQKISA